MLENWKTQVAFILASVNQLPFHAAKYRAFFELLADQMLAQKHDIWAYLFLKLLAGRFDFDCYETL